MKEGPDISRLGSLIGDPARANILTALMSGKALTASELANEAGVTLQTTSSHLKKLQEASLIVQAKQGRHRYFTLKGDDVGELLESMMGFAAKRGLLRTRTGPRDESLRKARVCYNHLAGEMGVAFYDMMATNGWLNISGDEVALTPTGEAFVTRFGIDLNGISSPRRPICRSCLDWSSRRHHLAGTLGVAILDRIYELGWASRIPGSRVIEFSSRGEKAFQQLLGI